MDFKDLFNLPKDIDDCKERILKNDSLREKIDFGACLETIECILVTYGIVKQKDFDALYAAKREQLLEETAKECFELLSLNYTDTESN